MSRLHELHPLIYFFSSGVLPALHTPGTTSTSAPRGLMTMSPAEAPFIGPSTPQKKKKDTTWAAGLMGLPNLQQGYLGAAPRRVRLALTIALCVPATVFLLMTEWFDEGLQAHRLLELLVRVVVVHPIGEWFGHWLLHKTANVQHHSHHVEIRDNHPGADEYEWWCYAAAALAYCSAYTRLASLGLMQYAWFHQMSHDWPALCPLIARHHGIHHLAPSRNQCISFSWPDRAFGSFLPRPPKAATPLRVEPMIEGREPPCYRTRRISEAYPVHT